MTYPLPTIVAHRGDPSTYPENTEISFWHCLKHGLKWLELDVHLSADGVPYVIHDARLERTTDGRGLVRETHSSILDTLNAGRQGIYGHDGGLCPLPRLETVGRLLDQFPDARAFVEIKREAFENRNMLAVARAIYEALGTAAHQCIPISFDKGMALNAFETWHYRQYGIVLDKWLPPEQIAGVFPDYVFIKDSLIPPDARLNGYHWKWVVYDVMHVDHVREWQRRGAWGVESSRPVFLYNALA